MLTKDTQDALHQVDSANIGIFKEDMVQSVKPVGVKHPRNLITEGRSCCACMEWRAILVTPIS